MTTEIIKIDPENYGLKKENVKSIEEAFMPKIVERNGLSVIYEQLLTKELTKELCLEAGNLRRKLVKVRTGIKEIHRTQKEFFLASGKFVDAWKNKETLPATQMEEKLTEIEKHFEILEQKRIEKLQKEREEELLKYEVDCEHINLGNMSDDIWTNFLTGTKTNYEAKIEAEKQAKADRFAKLKAEKEKQKQIRLENAKLKAKAEAREKELTEERIKAKAKQKAIEEKAKKEREEAEEKAEKIRKENEAKLKTEAEAREKAEKELQAKKEAERKEKEHKAKLLQEEDERLEKEKQAELNKGDLEKVKDLKIDLKALKNKYSFKSKKNKKMYDDVNLLIDKVINFIDEK